MAPLSIPNKNIFSDRQNLLYEVCFFACDGRQFHSPGPAAANPLSSKVSTSQLTMHVRHVVERTVVAREHRQKDSGRWLVRSLRWWNARERTVNERRKLNVTHARTLSEWLVVPSLWRRYATDSAGIYSEQNGFASLVYFMSPAC